MKIQNIPPGREFPRNPEFASLVVVVLLSHPFSSLYSIIHSFIFWTCFTCTRVAGYLRLIQFNSTDQAWRDLSPINFWHYELEYGHVGPEDINVKKSLCISSSPPGLANVVLPRSSLLLCLLLWYRLKLFCVYRNITRYLE